VGSVAFKLCTLVSIFQSSYVHWHNEGAIRKASHCSLLTKYYFIEQALTEAGTEKEERRDWMPQLHCYISLDTPRYKGVIEDVNKTYSGAILKYAKTKN
jgi:hypothetical protein